jgi:hypothetical protein
MAERAQYAETSNGPNFSSAAPFLNSPVFDSFARTSEAYSRAWLAWQRELLDFASLQLHSGAELGQALVQTRDPMDLARLQQEWIASTVQAYADEANRLMRLATSMGNDVAGTTREGVRRTAENGAEMMKRAGNETARAAENPRPRRRQREDDAPRRRTPFK